MIAQVDVTLRAVDVVIPILVTDDNEILPGQTCTLKISKCVTTDCLQIPLTALVPSIRGLWSCYRLQPVATKPKTYQVERVEVSVVHTDGSQAIVAAALSDGDLVIPSGVERVVPGMVVQVTPES